MKETGFTNAVKQLGKGWGVRNNNGHIAVRYRPTNEQVPIGLKWHESNTLEALQRIRAIYEQHKKGHNLKESAKRVLGSTQYIELDWKRCAEKFKDQKINHGTTIKPDTWKSKYEPVVSMAVDLLTKIKPPSNSIDLIDLCIKDWKPGSRSRQIRAQNLAQFLRHCVNREGFSPSWLPPTDLSSHIGRALPNQMSYKGDPIKDENIIELIASLPTDEAGQRWADAIRLMAVYGLRPIELKHLHVKTDNKTQEAYLFCSYQKRAGGGVTRPRILYPLPVCGHSWTLLQRLQANLLKLPPLRSDDQASDSFLTYLGRQKYWKQLKADMLKDSQRLVPYSFRHAYSLRGHVLGLDSSTMADAMGHNIDTHNRSYPWSSESNTKAQFNKLANHTY